MLAPGFSAHEALTVALALLAVTLALSLAVSGRVRHGGTGSGSSLTSALGDKIHSCKAMVFLSVIGLVTDCASPASTLEVSDALG